MGVRLNGMDNEIEEASEHLELFDLYKKEFKAIRSLWKAKRDQVNFLIRRLFEPFL